MDLTPKQIVHELNKYIIGQDEAKKAVAIALRNRYRRSQLSPELQDEVTPKNIIMKGPTGVGKTEIARRLAKLVKAPFLKVEATKYTEVGYVGRDVESMVRDLAESAIRLVKEEKMQESPKIVKEESDYVSKVRHLLDDKWNLLYKNVERVLEKVSLKPHKEQIETVPAIIFPDDKPKEAAQIQIHPTVCIFNHSSEPRGELICDRKGVFPDFQLEKSASILGKNPKAELHIDKDTISLFHARIEYQDGEYYIEDLNSTNGTYINDEPLYYKKKRRLEADDKIRFADVTYHFY